ncbi:hypothetical protein [Nonomuraea sp. NPDC002799]
MATVPVPRTWTVAELLTAAKMNTDVRDGLNFLLSPPLAILRKNASQAATNSAHTIVTWEVEDIDRDGGHSTVTNTSRYTSQTAGYYQLSGEITFAANGSGWRDIMFQKNGTTSTRQSRNGTPAIPSGTADSALNLTGTMFLGVGDYAEILAYQTSGGALNMNVSNQDCRFEARWVSK